MGILKHKKLTPNRNITIPKDICAFVGLEGSTPIDVEGCDNGDVVIRKHAPTCRFCGDKLSAVTCMGVDVCPVCAAKLAKEVTSNA